MTTARQGEISSLDFGSTHDSPLFIRLAMEGWLAGVCGHALSCFVNKPGGHRCAQASAYYWPHTAETRRKAGGVKNLTLKRRAVPSRSATASGGKQAARRDCKLPIENCQF